MVFYTFAKMPELHAKHALNYLKSVVSVQNVCIFTWFACIAIHCDLCREQILSLFTVVALSWCVFEFYLGWIWECLGKQILTLFTVVALSWCVFETCVEYRFCRYLRWLRSLCVVFSFIWE